MSHVLIAANPRGLSTSFEAEAMDLLQKFDFLVGARETLHPQKAFRLLCQSSKDFDHAQMKQALVSLSDAHETDLALIPEAVYRKPKKLLIFDMDSTLIQHEVIDEMAVRFGIGDQVKEITKRAMNGELNFDQSLSERVGLLKGLKREALHEIATTLKLMPGAERLMEIARKSGAKTVIASGGFSFFAEQICARLRMDEYYANTLEWRGDELTGKVTGEIVNAAFKASLVESLARQSHLGLDEVVAVGDGANDIPMLLKAGLGVAFHAKPKVRQEANHQLHYGPMHTLLYFLNIPGDHFL